MGSKFEFGDGADYTVAMATYFISDLHLQESRPAAVSTFVDFLRRIRADADHLYILGDLFEAWIGDDDDAEFARRLCASLAEQTRAHPVSFIHGNRDFLVGNGFAADTGVSLLADETSIDLYGRPALLMHGDTLCTDDVDYQKFRALTRSAAWQQGFLVQTLAARRAFAEQARAASQAAMQGKSETIMDANLDAVRLALSRHQCTLLIHGHTHRPAVHTEQQAQVGGLRIVLGDWYEQGSVLRADADGERLSSFAFTSPHPGASA